MLKGHGRLLERIYELDQKESWLPEEGQLKDQADRQEKINQIEEYKKVHGIGMVWPEVSRNMKEIGVLDMELYLMGTRAFLIMDAKPEYDPDKDNERWGNMPREKEWQAYVAKYQKIDPESSISEKWRPMDRIL